MSETYMTLIEVCEQIDVAAGLVDLQKERGEIEARSEMITTILSGVIENLNAVKERYTTNG